MTCNPRNEPAFRPPAEAGSVLIQTDTGCPWNACAFCGMYRDTPFESRGLDDVFTLIHREALMEPDARRVFLADGDVMARPYAELKAILDELAVRFPRLARVNLYATGRSIRAKTPFELGQLHAAKLHTLYLGLESGDEPILQRMAKGESAADMADAVCRAQSAGLHASVMILLGLGGQADSDRHARATAAVLNRMQPRLLSALRVVPVPGTPLWRWIREGLFRELTEQAVVAELRLILADLAMESTVFRANHASNVFPLEGRLPRDRKRLLDELDHLLASGRLDTKSPGPMPFSL
ncbi:MAG: hypothetical protein A2498_10180 [Lentisphaerae bacterium RIFOXYC12_FULL_60_16]|nr:MAG: hypothetical protein A2498_10180 [Lentisphaerae bacterium RIFOXYC12_FULL_60_16]OGV85435.1 MAG: hypothetical protein A2340_09220 [Lentisphaerae bacterium RIFOXYB12_FULL_60_10]